MPPTDTMVKDYGLCVVEDKPCRVQVFFRPFGGGLMGLESNPGYYLRFAPGEKVSGGSGILKKLVDAERQGNRRQGLALKEAEKFLVAAGIQVIQVS